MKLSFYRKDSKLKGISFNLLGCGFAKVGMVMSLHVGNKINFAKVGKNFSLTAFGKTLSHTQVIQ